MTYTDIKVLPRTTLLSIVNEFPTSAIKFRRAAILLALRRHITNVANEIRARKAEEQASEGVGTFLDKVHAAAGTVSQSQAASVQMATELEVSMKKGRRESTIGGTDVIDNSVPAGFVEEMRSGMKTLQEQMRELQRSVQVLTAAMVEKNATS